MRLRKYVEVCDSEMETWSDSRILWSASKSVKVAFKKVDRDRSGTISKDEMTMAMCHFVFQLSKKIPGIAEVPSRSEVDAYFDEFAPGKTAMNMEEFEEFLAAW